MLLAFPLMVKLISIKNSCGDGTFSHSLRFILLFELRICDALNTLCPCVGGLFSVEIFSKPLLTHIGSMLVIANPCLQGCINIQLRANCCCLLFQLIHSFSLSFCLLFWCLVLTLRSTPPTKGKEFTTQEMRPYLRASGCSNSVDSSACRRYIHSF